MLLWRRSTKNSPDRQFHPPSFAKVLDGRKQPIRGPWVRNGRYYAQLKIENAITGIKKTKRVPLLDKDIRPVETVAQAVAEMNRLRTQRAGNALPVLTRQPKFVDYTTIYLDAIGGGQGGKKLGTWKRKKPSLPAGRIQSANCGWIKSSACM